MAAVNPYLTFNGTCEAAFNLYKSVFGGEFGYMGRFKDMPSPDRELPEEVGNLIMHVSLPISLHTVLMGSDASEAFGQVANVGDNISVSVNTDSEEEARRIFDGLAEGGVIKMPLEKTFWGAFFGMLVDKFGIHWMVNYDYAQNS